MGQAGVWMRARKPNFAIVFWTGLRNYAVPVKNNKSTTKYTSSGESSTSSGGSKNPKGQGVKVKVRHILCAKQAKILEELAKLDVGTSFSEVAKTYSEEKPRSGGDLGWKVHGSMVPEFEAAAFSAPLNEYSQPIKTEYGHHILLVEDRE